MIDIRPFASLGAANHGWLDAHHHFSFGDYRDPARMGWGSIRVWNDDLIAPNTGFPPHAHSDMEIITYVRTGAITHEDSMGNKGRTEAGDVQVMSAASGVRHSEWNAEDVPTTLFQIWIEPNRTGGAPGWGAKPFPKDSRSGRWSVLASGFGDMSDEDRDALPIRADARVLGATLRAGDTLTHEVGAGRHAYLVAAIGGIEIADGTASGESSPAMTAAARDGVALGTGRYTIRALGDAELVLVDAA